jgi:predicted MFS family arabinose efflux permease
VAIQDAVDGPVRARVLGLQAALFQGGQGIGGLFMGLATDRWGVVVTLLAGAAIVAIVTAATLVAWPRPRPAPRLAQPPG